MAFRVLGDVRDTQDIVVVDSGSSTLTGLDRQDALLRGGHAFEAAIARAALVEGLLLHYLLVAKQVRGCTFDIATEKRLAVGRITFGQTKDALKAASAFHDSKLALDVEAFVGDRNHVAHHMAAGHEPFDLIRFFRAGRTIAESLWHHVLAETESHRRANP